jgi:hypothetical protein
MGVNHRSDRGVIQRRSKSERWLAGLRIFTVAWPHRALHGDIVTFVVPFTTDVTGVDEDRRVDHQAMATIVRREVEAVRERVARVSGIRSILRQGVSRRNLDLLPIDLLVGDRRGIMEGRRSTS